MHAGAGQARETRHESCYDGRCSSAAVGCALDDDRLRLRLRLRLHGQRDIKDRLYSYVARWIINYNQVGSWWCRSDRAEWPIL
jgi:hypothetical protein